VFLLPIVGYLLLFYAYPLAYGVSTSFQHYDLTAMIAGHAAFVGLANYAAAYRDPIFAATIARTAAFTAFSIVFQFSVGFALAALFVRSFPLSRTLRSLLLIPWLLPIAVSATVWRWLLDQTNGIVDQLGVRLHLLPPHFGWLTAPPWPLVAVIVANIWIGIPFNMVTLHSGLQGVPAEYYEASEIDGAGVWHRFWRITVPLLRPVIAVVLMLGVVYTLKVFDVIYVMTAGGPANTSQTLSTWSYNLSFNQQLFGEGSAAANMILVASLAAAALYMRWSRDLDRIER
jgi:multiple sugar transport system permease protein